MSNVTFFQGLFLIKQLCLVFDTKTDDLGLICCFSVNPSMLHFVFWTVIFICV